MSWPVCFGVSFSDYAVKRESGFIAAVGIAFIFAFTALYGGDDERVTLTCPAETVAYIEGDGEDRCCARVRLVPELTGPGANDPDVFVVNDYGIDPQPHPDDIHQVVFSGRIALRFDRANIFGLGGDRTTTYSGQFTYTRGFSDGPRTKTDQITLREFTLTAGNRVFVGLNPQLHVTTSGTRYRFVVSAGLP